MAQDTSDDFWSLVLWKKSKASGSSAQENLKRASDSETGNADYQQEWQENALQHKLHKSFFKGKISHKVYRKQINVDVKNFKRFRP